VRPMRGEFHDYRGYAGTVAGGTLRVGDEVMVLPSGLTTTIIGIDTPDGRVEECRPPMAVTLLLADDVDISRGDMICRPNNRPHAEQDLEAMVCWMDGQNPLVPGKIYSVKHTTRTARARVSDLRYRLDINTLHRDQDATQLSLNEIGRIAIRTTQPLFYDDYHRNRQTGSFIMIDEGTNSTVAGGMLLGPTS
jgi:bifunctional enzyme CysN/CysC